MNIQPAPENFSRLLIVAGVVLVILGVILSFARTRPWSLPGDIHWSGRGWQIWLPLGTSLLLSLVLTLALNLLLRRR